MLVCRIELWPKGDPLQKRDLAIVAIANIGGDAEHGDYQYGISHQAGTPYADRVGKNALDPHRIVTGIGAWKHGTLKGFARKLGAVVLFGRVLKAALGR